MNTVKAFLLLTKLGLGSNVHTTEISCLPNIYATSLLLGDIIRIRDNMTWHDGISSFFYLFTPGQF